MLREEVEDRGPELLAFAGRVAQHGFTTHKLKAGVFEPEHEVRVFRAIAEALPGHRVRIDPNAAWSVEQAILAVVEAQ